MTDDIVSLAKLNPGFIDSRVVADQCALLVKSMIDNRAIKAVGTMHYNYTKTPVKGEVIIGVVQTVRMNNHQATITFKGTDGYMETYLHVPTVIQGASRIGPY